MEEKRIVLGFKVRGANMAGVRCSQSLKRIWEGGGPRRRVVSRVKGMLGLVLKTCVESTYMLR